MITHDDLYTVFLSGTPVRSGDLLIDDNVESHTILGDGKAGLIDADVITDPLPLRNRPKSAKLRSMGGPISSNLDVSTSCNYYYRKKPHRWCNG